MAAGWYCRAAEKGNAAAQVTLGMICLSGQSVDRDTEKAAQSFKSTAEQGDARAIQSGAAHSRRRRGPRNAALKPSCTACVGQYAYGGNCGGGLPVGNTHTTSASSLRDCPRVPQNSPFLTGPVSPMS
jgi:TPR repeat protein